MGNSNGTCSNPYLNIFLNPGLKEGGNRFVRLNGNNNSGVVENNTNTVLSGYNNELNLGDNVNAKFNITNNVLKSFGTTNTDFDGEGNNVGLNGDTNVRFRGNKNQLNFDHNVNCRVIGNQNIGGLSGNTNLELSGDANEVTAERNTNLIIDGNGNNISILRTTNHAVKNVGYNNDECSTNIVRIIPTGNRDSSIFNFGSRTAMNENPGLRYLIDYVKEARITDNDYSVGMFKFRMEEINNAAHISFHDNEFDPGSVQITQVSPRELGIVGRKNGCQQVLIFFGPRISHHFEGDNTVDIKVDNGADAV